MAATTTGPTTVKTAAIEVTRDVADDYKLGQSLAALVADHAEWSQRTFGSYVERGPIGPLKHLEKEAGEAQQSPWDRAEYADCFICLLDAMGRVGMSAMDLVREAAAKMEVNKARAWPSLATGRPPDEPVEHLRSPIG